MMDTICVKTPSGELNKRRLAFLEANGLRPGQDSDLTVVIEEDGEILACGTRSGSILKYMAVSPDARGEGLTDRLLTELRKDAFEKGISRLFLYTKPANRSIFEGSGFYPVEESGDVLLLENRRNGIGRFLDGIKEQAEASGLAQGPAGAIVMNADPFTLGHRYLVEQALEDCGKLFIFVLSEDLGTFPAEDRLKLVKEGTADLKNAAVFTTGGYLVSSATFPDYFLKEETSATEAQCGLDCLIFARRFAPALDITMRYAGSEPYSAVTAAYNRAMKNTLPSLGVGFTEYPRLAAPSGAPLSAGTVREILASGRPDREALEALVPRTTLDYLISRGLA